MAAEETNGAVAPSIDDRPGTFWEEMPKKASPAEEVAHQLDRAALFSLGVMARTDARMTQLETYMSGLLTLLDAKGVAPEDELKVVMAKIDEFERAAEMAKAEAEGLLDPEGPPVSSGEPETEVTQPIDPRTGAPQVVSANGVPVADTLKSFGWPSIALRIDPEGEHEEPGPDIDCTARMHICHSVCCKLAFPLSGAEVEAGKVKWDLGHPYMIRHDSDGFCVHNDRSNGYCGVYHDRPAICRKYTCEKDTRIWKDFENMVLNEEFLAEHMANTGAIRFVARPSMEVRVTISDKPAAQADAERAPAPAH